MSNFQNIQDKLEQFIKKFYTNELIKGAILFFAIGLLYLIITLLIEYFLWLNPTARTVLFWMFVIVELALFVRFIAFPLAKLFKLQKGIDYETASKIIGNHFPEVNDKLLNVLQLKQDANDSELLLASIEQKSAELQPIPFKLAVNFKQNVKYLKYAAIPVLILFLSYISGKFNWFSDSYERVVNYQTAYEPPAPFKFFVVNNNLQALENKDFKLQVRTSGERVPENVQINFNNETYFLQQTGVGEFEYVFNKLKGPVTFNLSANSVTSKPYNLEVLQVPTLLSFEMFLDYPSHTKKRDEVLKSSGNAVVPQGTKITWKLNTKATESVQLFSKDTIAFSKAENGKFEASKRIYNNFDYNLSTSNSNLKNYENLAFNIDVIKDEYPELNVKMQIDSLDQQSLYFYGQVSDDYGLTKLQLVYYPSENEKDRKVENIAISKSNFDEFISAFPNNLEVEEGVAYDLFFQVFDNDVVNKFKNAKSKVFTYRKRTQAEEEQKQLQEQNETIQDLNKSLNKFNEQDKQLEEFSKTQKEKSELNFNDKKKFEEFLKRQKRQEDMMQNFNKKLKENLEEFQKENEQQDEFKEDLKERLKENEEQLKKDEKLLDELEKLQEKLSKEELTQKLEQLAKQNKNKKRSLEQLLELTKRYYVGKKMEKLQKELEQLADEQEKLSKENSKDKNNKEAQDKLNKKFEDFKKQLEELQKDNKKLRKPLDVPNDKKTEKEIEEEQKKASEELGKQEPKEAQKGEQEQNPKGEQQEQEQQEGEQQETPQMPQNMQNAQQSQKSAAKKMRKMSQKMAQAMPMSGGGGDQMQEDIDTLRQILDNLVLFSFNQEALMDNFKSIQINHNKYATYLRKQSNLREHFEHVDDSLFALSLRQPKISEKVNTEITNVFYSIDKSLAQFSENRLYQGVASQQYTITAANTLADFLSNVLDNMEMQMNASPGQGQGDMQLPDIIMSQEQLNEQMKEQMEKQDGKKEGEQQGEQQGNKEGEESQQDGDKKEGNEGKESDKGDKPKGKKEGKQGQQKDGEGEQYNEDMNGEIFKIYQQQQQLRQALEQRLDKEGKKEGAGGQLLKDMEEVELELLNKGFTNQTLQKMMELQHQLLKLENATFQQGKDNKRQSKTNKDDFGTTPNNAIPTAKQYFNTTEILNRQALPLQSTYKKKVQQYFKKKND